MNGQARTLRAAVLLTTYLQAVSVSMPNAALRFIQASLSMADDQAGWMFTSYLAASAITLPVAQWLAARWGMKAVYQASMAGFILGLLLASVATAPLGFIGARLLQGAASGLLAPLSLAIALETLAPARRPTFGTFWTAITLVGITSGPAIGAVVSEYLGWPWMFYASVGGGLLSFVAVGWLFEAKQPGTAPALDGFGIATFTLGMIGLQLFLDRGERLEWFDSPEICLEAAAGALGLYLFVAHVATANVHFINKGLLRDRNFVVSTLIFFGLGFVLLPTMALTSPMLDEVLGYPPVTTGYMTLPRAVGLVGAFWLMARVPAHLDHRPMVVISIAVVVYANGLMVGYSPLMDGWPVAVAGAIQGIGLGALMPSISKVACSTLEPGLRAEGTGLFNLARVHGSALGVALVQTLLFSNTQAMHQALVSHLTPYAGAVQGLSGSAPLSVLANLNERVSAQATFVALIDQFKVLMLAMVMLIPLALLLRKPAAAN